MFQQAAQWIRNVAMAATGWGPLDDRWYPPYGGGVPTQSGVPINEDIALTYAAVFMIVSKYAKTMATIPVHVMQRVSDRERQPVDHLPLGPPSWGRSADSPGRNKK